MAFNVRGRPGRRRVVGWAGGALLLTYALVWALVAAGWSPLLRLDTDLVTDAYQVVRGHDGWVQALEVVAIVGSTATVRALLLLVAAVALFQRRTVVATWLVVSAVLEAVIVQTVKLVQQRPRPAWPEPLTEIAGYGFPSGHASGAGLLVATMLVLTHLLVSRRSLRRAIDAGWIGVGLVIALDRVLLGVHYPSDVVAGVALGSGLPLVVAAVAVPWAVIEIGPAPTTTGRRPSWLGIVLNPTKVSDPAGLRRLVAAAAERHGWQPPCWYETTADDAGIAMTHQALADGAEVIVAAGGDGTVRVVSSELARTGVPLGVVPLGTGNLLARNLELPLRATEAVEAALSGQDRAIDVVRVSGDGLPETCFTVMGGLGFDAAVMAGASDALKARMGWRAYVVSAVRNLHYPASRVEVSVDDAPFVRFRARTVVIGNVGLLQAGIPLLPDARVDDGMLDVVVITPQRLSGWLRVVVRVLTRGRVSDESLARMTGTQVVVRCNQPVARQLDGDSIGEGRELRARVMAGTLLVRVPR
ncbi:MAG: phosphatase PAP2 family protein [Nocardioidaceae bacterium]|nr:phosphatase PAP2 family protein [Nocardioidaceae bacterium]